MDHTGYKILNTKRNLLPHGEFPEVLDLHLKDIGDFWPHALPVYGPTFKMLSYQLTQEQCGEKYVELIDGLYPIMHFFCHKRNLANFPKIVYSKSYEEFMPQEWTSYNCSTYAYLDQQDKYSDARYGVLDFYDSYTSPEFLKIVLKSITLEAKSVETYYLFTNFVLNSLAVKTESKYLLELIRKLPENVVIDSLTNFPIIDDFQFRTVDLYLDPDLLASSTLQEIILARNGRIVIEPNENEIVARYQVALGVEKIITKNVRTKFQGNAHLANDVTALVLPKKNIEDFLNFWHLKRLRNII